MNALIAEELWRANTYRLLARLLIDPIDADLHSRLQSIPESQDESALRQAWSALGESSRRLGLKDSADQFQTLFIGPPRGALMPYASWYLTGFLMDKPLARLRAELIKLGIERQPSIKEPEDHISALFESMSLLIEANDARQSDFFAGHLYPWVPRFFKDLNDRMDACFYREVGALGVAFMAFETVYIHLPAD